MTEKLNSLKFNQKNMFWDDKLKTNCLKTEFEKQKYLSNVLLIKKVFMAVNLSKKDLIRNSLFLPKFWLVWSNFRDNIERENASVSPRDILRVVGLYRVLQKSVYWYTKAI